MRGLPLKYHTPKRWGAFALQNPLALLSDHAYLEKKAATNALDLLNHWPEPRYPKTWMSSLTTVAKDETQHLARVTQLLQKKGGKLNRLHQSRYAQDLRKLVRRGLTPEETVDRLLVSALIEARSCERFQILAATATDPDLKHLYKSLHAAEKGHYKLFLNLAGQLVPKSDWKKRWDELCHAEAEIIQAQPLDGSLHSACPA
jgi:tRNA-(ms[2]io[6]A)-hydroxylase